MREEQIRQQLRYAKLRMMQSLPLEDKVKMSERRIREWVNKWGENNVHVTFSGGKDSTVLLHIVREVCGYKNIPGVFADTGIEYPEIREFVKSTPNVVWMKPKIPFPKVIEKYGYPVVSKKAAQAINTLQNPTPNNAATRNLYLTGITKTGKTCEREKLAKKWHFVVDAPFKVSHKCCDVMKKEPFNRYEKEFNSYPMTGVMANESKRREKIYIDEGCISYGGKHPQARPIMIWGESDIWDYLKTRNVPYCDIYNKGVARTGCVFCAFGVHAEKGENRFQKLKKTHPKLHKYCMDKLGMRKVLDFMGIPYQNVCDFIDD